MAPETRPVEAIDDPLPGVVGRSRAMHEVYRLTRLVAPARASVLLVGETGTGKELIAHAIHRYSRRADGPYVRVNCGALTESLLESELFGHVKGAFTGAIENKTGRFEAAHTGTLFLDEIPSISPKLQVKLLRVLQEREFERVGESKTIQVDVRVIAATNRFLEDEVAAGRFREDLYYRLNVIPLYLPPLRERKADIPELVEFFLTRCAEENGKSFTGLAPMALQRLLDHDWPGNVRELVHVIERAVVLAEGPELNVEHLVFNRRVDRGGNEQENLLRQLVRTWMAGPEGEDGRLHDRLVGGVERELIAQVLRACDGVQVKAAARLGINRNTLHKKVEEFGLH